MKKLLFIILTFASLSAFGQAGSLSQSVYRSRVNDSTTVNGSHSAGYGDFYWNNQASTPGWRVWNGSSYDIGFSSGGATAAGATGNVQYKSAGGGLQAETAFSYDSATNTLDADIVTVNDDAYSESGWNGSVAVPTKNAIRDKIESMYNADLTAIANMAPANGDFIYRESGTWVKKTTAETAAIIYAVGGDPAFITNLSIHGDAGAGVILTNQANTEQGFNNTGRTTRYFDATGYNYIQVACQVSTLSASANTPRLYPRYSTDNSTYNLIGSGSGTNIIDLSSTGHKLTDWIALPTGAKALVYFSVGQNGGNGTADPEIGYLEVRLKK